MIRVLKTLVLLPLAIFIIFVAAANREPVRISLDPTPNASPEWSLTMPLFMALFAAVLIGILIGGIASWLNQGHHRKAERRYKKEAEALRSRIEQSRPAPPALS